MRREILLNKTSVAVKFLTALLYCVMLSSSAKAQDTTFIPEPDKVIYGNFSQIYIDNLLNYYLVNERGDGFVKLNAGADSIGAYNEVKRYGKVTSMDVANPLKVLLYYKDFNVVLALDRLLNTTASFDLRRSGILQSSAIALSYDNNIWVYDSRDTRLKKIDESGKVIFESADFKTLFADVPQPSKIIDNDGVLYLYDKNFGLIIFDYYGALKTAYPFKGYEDVFVYNQTFFGRKNKTLFYSQLNAHKENFAELPVDTISQMYVMRPYIFFLSSGNVTVYKNEIK